MMFIVFVFVGVSVFLFRIFFFYLCISDFVLETLQFKQGMPEDGADGTLSEF